jgi:Zn-finger nucleic acid-binding protein
VAQAWQSSYDFFKEIRAYAALKAHRLKSRTDDAASLPHSNGLCCLNDGQPMMHLKFKGIEFSACSSCFSLWLEQGQLEQLIAAIGISGKTDLSRIGNSLATVNNKGGLNSLGDAVDLFDFSDSITNIIEGISDL